MRYAGFWSRFVAGLIDGVVTVPVILLVYWLERASYTGAVISNLVGPAFLILYNVGLVAVYGGTLGKLMRGLRVLKVNGNRAAWSNAWRRSAVDLTFSFSAVILTLIALNRIGPDVYLAANQDTRAEMLEVTVPAWILWATFIWMLSEFVTLLSNRKRRALHDFIAGTVVVHTAPQPVDARPGPADPQKIPAQSY